MAARRNGRRGGASQHHEEQESEERWLLTYADMITLLMTLFMVLFAISSVNVTKFELLSKSLSEAISGKIVQGGPNLQESGATDAAQQSSPEPPIPAIQPAFKSESSSGSPAQTAGDKTAAQREEEDFKELKSRIDEYARDHGLESVLQTTVARRGLVIRLLTDKVLFASGEAQLQQGSTRLLDKLADLLASEVRHPIVVEGHTDDRPISSAQFPTNWELSTARSTQVVRFFIGHGVGPSRLQAAGVAAERPVSSNSTERGRSRNRRVEIVLVRLNSPSTQDGP